jgi:hypothetical protein
MASLVLDGYVGAILTANPNMLIPHYLMHSYLYYQMDDPVVSDSMFDTICKRLLAELDGLNHMHKHLVDRSLLVAGSGFNLQFPAMVVGAALYLHRNKKALARARQAPVNPADL